MKGKISSLHNIFHGLSQVAHPENRFIVLYFEADVAVDGPGRGDILVHLEGLQLGEGGPGQILKEGVHHAGSCLPGVAPGCTDETE